MQNVSAVWPTTVVGSYRMVVRVDAMLGGEVVAPNLAVTSGQVVMDGDATVRGSLRVDLAEPTLVPVSSDSPLAPFGAELAVWVGVVHPSTGATEMVPWGVFGIQDSDVDRRGLATSLNCLDRMQLLADAGLAAEYPVSAGTDWVTAIVGLIAASRPDLAVKAPATAGFTTPVLTVSPTDNVADRAAQWARDVGMELFADHDGSLVLRERASTGDPVVTFSDGEGGVLLDARVSMSRAGAVNQVTVTANQPANTTLISATATDTDPRSPTVWDGNFGRKPLRPPITSPNITTAGQAALAAQAELESRRGVPRTVKLETVPNPALQVGDTVQVSTGTLVVGESHVLQRVTLGLTAQDRQLLETRQVLTL